MKSGLLTHDLLLERAASAGESLTMKELLRWRRQGLLPPSKRVGPLRGKKHLAYPPETAFVVLALCRLRYRFRHHPAGLVVALWVEGYDLPCSKVHQALHHVLDPLPLRSQPSQADPLTSVLGGLQRVFLSLRGRKPTRSLLSRQTRWKHQPGLFASPRFIQRPAGPIRSPTAPLDEGPQDRLLVHWLMTGYEYLQTPSAQTPERGRWPLEGQISNVKRLILEGAFSIDRFFPEGMVIPAAQLEQARTDYHRCLLLWQRTARALERVVGATILRHEGFRLWREAPWTLGWALLVLVRMRTLGCETLLEALEELFGQTDEHVSGTSTSQDQQGTRWHDVDTTAPSS